MFGILDLRHNYSILLYEKKHESKILVLLSRQYLVDKVPEMPNKRKELPTKMKGRHEESYANNLENMFEYVERHGIYPQSAYLNYGYYKDRNREPLDLNSKKYSFWL